MGPFQDDAGNWTYLAYISAVVLAIGVVLSWLLTKARDRPCGVCGHGAKRHGFASGCRYATTEWRCDCDEFRRS
jgi:hypothetical protein